MAERPAAPAELLPLITGRSSFANLWVMSAKMQAPGAIAVALAERGWPRQKIVAALLCHPDMEVSPQVAGELVDSATIKPKSASTMELPEPRIVRVLEQRPRTFEVELAGTRFTVRAAEVGTSSAFRMACLDQCAIVPQLPPPKYFDQWLAAQIADAEHVAQPDEASDEGMERDVVETVLQNMPSGDSISEIRQLRKVYLDGYDYIHGTSVYLRAVRPVLPSLTNPRFYAILRDLQWIPHEYDVSGERYKTWRQQHIGSAPVSWSAKLSEVKRQADLLEGNDYIDVSAEFFRSDP